MAKAKSVHFLHVSGPTCELDVYAAYLSLLSRSGTRTIEGAECREHRDQLAALLDDGLLAELLRSERPIRVEGVVNGYRIEEV